ncbi:hypothetical protein GN244_ATG13775 [Phytophthora infestans]|uniref:Uncharacterized protein n=1 Tax=Phytophthora infestans TaxID=4787 RepID=A0A833SX66_PHYIN|nr:hypothetical protein GN244_ATG13775 [Phytophthora infestans]
MKSIPAMLDEMDESDPEDIELNPEINNTNQNLAGGAVDEGNARTGGAVGGRATGKRKRNDVEGGNSHQKRVRFEKEQHKPPAR